MIVTGVIKGQVTCSDIIDDANKNCHRIPGEIPYIHQLKTLTSKVKIFPIISHHTVIICLVYCPAFSQSIKV